MTEYIYIALSDLVFFHELLASLRDPSDCVGQAPCGRLSTLSRVG